MANLEKISQIILDNMVPGDIPVYLQQRTMKMWISKKTANELTADTFSSSGSSVDVPSFCELLPQDCLNDGGSEQRIISLTVSYALCTVPKQ